MGYKDLLILRYSPRSGKNNTKKAKKPVNTQKTTLRLPESVGYSRRLFGLN
jgi:hypothetical protein